MSIESTIVGWISGNTSAGTRVSVGARLQDTALPAITIEVPNGEYAELKPSHALARYTCNLTAIAESMSEAKALVASAFGYVSSSADLGNGAAWYTNFGAIEEPIPGEGDEAEPAVCNATIEILYPS